MKPTQALHEAGQSLFAPVHARTDTVDGWQDLLARIGARHEQLSR